MDRVSFLQGDRNTSRLGKIADLLGIEHEVISEIPQHPSCIIMPGRSYDSMRSVIEHSPHFVLVYDASSSDTFFEYLSPFRHSCSTIEVTRERPDFTAVLSGLNLSTNSAGIVFSSPSDFDVLFSSDGHPLFLTKGRLFVLASHKVVDLDNIADPGCEPHKEHFLGLIPFAMFIKWVFKDRCWHLPSFTASIIIDDPLLRKRYGSIDFVKFVSWLEANDLAATFAFIPWNHNRSDPTIADMFRSNAKLLSICVHGCDHTSAEFGITHAARLDTIIKTATTRMTKHEIDYGISYDRVMVFPQGKFSDEALKILMQNGYCAAVNTTLFPVNYSGNLTVRDLLDLARPTASGVPLFQRRYPVDLFDFACDIFFEKPVLIVQHHQDFNNGFDNLLSFIQRLREIKPDLKWQPLGTVLDQSYWQRLEPIGTLKVRKVTCRPWEGSWVEMNYSLKERIRVALRRYLSEFRDNHVDRNRIVNTAIRAMFK